jgi:hypothetical protein
VTALAIVAHEIPQEVGDFIVLVNAGFSRAKALLYNALSGLAAVAGGVLGYFVVGPWQALFPYLLVVAASSFIYVAVADLMPQLQRRLRGATRPASWAGWLGGLGLVLLAMSLRTGPSLPRTRVRRLSALTCGPGPGRPSATTSTRQLAVRQHLLRLAAQQQRATPAAAVRGHHDQVAALGLGVVEDRLPGVQRLDRVAGALHAGARGGIGHGLHVGRGDALLRVVELLRRHRLHLGDGAVGKGSFTPMVNNSAPASGQPIAVCTALAVISEPSVGTRMRLYMVAPVLRIAGSPRPDISVFLLRSVA